MKKTCMVILLAAAVAPASLFAQKECPTTTPSADKVAARVTRQVDQLTRALTLTAPQPAEATTIFTTEATCSGPIEITLCDARQKLNADVHSTSDGIGTLLGGDAIAVGAAEGQALQCSATADNAFWNILTPAQQTTLEHSRRGRGFGPGPGGPGPWGPGGPGPQPGGFPGSGPGPQ